ncbi:transcriptional regulator RcsB [compost metagenome]
MNIIKKVVTVAIVDTNRFFLDGLRLGVLEHFRKKGLLVNFVSGPSMGHADIIFQHIIVGRPSFYCSRIQSELSYNPLFFFIYDSVAKPGTLQWQDRDGCLRNGGNVYRNESLNVVIPRVYDALIAANKKSQETNQKYGCCCRRHRLTSREYQVLRYFSMVGSSNAVARLLKISAKSVSTHKRSAMLKIGLRNNLDLYHWLRLERKNTGRSLSIQS